mgnify:CR=1 FL=1
MGKRSFAKPLLFKLTSLALVVTLLSVGVTTFFVARFAHRTLDLMEREELQEKIAVIGQTSKRMIKIVDARGDIVVDTIPRGMTEADLIMVEVALDQHGLLLVGIEQTEIGAMLHSLIRGSILIGLVVATAASPIRIDPLIRL